MKNKRVVRYHLMEAYFLRAGEATYDYTVSDLIRYPITFGVDYYELEFFDKKFSPQPKI